MSDPPHEPALQRLLAMAAEDDDGPPALPERYELVRELGRGGMGIVYECVDRQLERRCAVKTIRAGAGADAALRRRFVREALAAARLEHPHIAAVYDASEECISMQLVRGGPIDAIAATPHEFVELVRDAARALHHAHRAGIVHRDVKPTNLLLEGRHVYVVDFGLAKALDPGASASLAGAVVGTPAFMAPEQARGEPTVDARSDVYGLGATLFACLRGRPPFAAADLPALLRDVVDRNAPPLGVDRDLDLVVAKCLRKEPAQRYATAAELADDLDRWLADEPIAARPLSLRYRLQKGLRRHRTLWRAAAAAALLAIAATALVLVPIAVRAGAMRAAASEAVELADHAAALLQEATLLGRLGDVDTANQVLDGGIAKVREFLGRNDVPRARYLLSRLLRARGQPAAAVDEAHRALAADPALVDARFERGILLAALSQPTEAQRATAIADLTVGLGERSALTSVDRLFGRAELLRLQGSHAEAMELLKGVLEYDLTNVGARLSLSRAAQALGQDDLASYYASSAMDLQRGYGAFFAARERSGLPTAMHGLGAALVDYAGALRDGVASDLATAFRGLVLLRRALRLEREGAAADALGAVAAALLDHDEVLLVHDGLAGALNNRGVCRLVQSRLYAAAGDGAGAAVARGWATADFEAAFAAAPAMPEARCNLGIAALELAGALRALGRWPDSARQAELAVAALDAALQAAPDDWPHVRLCRERLAAATALAQR